jgi:hypothetical protein
LIDLPIKTLVISNPAFVSFNVRIQARAKPCAMGSMMGHERDTARNDDRRL